MAGLAPPAGLHGQNLTPLLREPESAWPRPAYTVVARAKTLGRSIASGRYRYTEWDEGRLGVELYDHDNDPHEYRNLAGDKAYSAVIRELKQKLAATRPKPHPALIGVEG